MEKQNKSNFSKMDSTCLPMKLFSRAMTGHILSPNTSENRRLTEESIQCLVKVKQLPEDHRTRFRDCLADSRSITCKPQRAPFLCLSEESPSASIFICDAISQQSDTALVTLQTPRTLTDPKTSHSFCSISHRGLPQLGYNGSVLTVTPRPQCWACGQRLQSVRAESVACQAPDDHNYPPLKAFKSIQVNLCDLEKLPRVHFKTPQCVSCGASMKINVPGNPLTKDTCNQEAHNYGIPICKGNLCPCFTALAQKQHLCLSSTTEKLQTSEKVSDKIETCMPLSQKQNISSSSKIPTLQSFGKSCQSKTKGSVTNSNIEKAHISKHPVSSEQHKDRDRCKYRCDQARRIINTNTFSKNILKAEDRTKQHLAPIVKQSYNIDKRTPQPTHVMQYPFLKRKCVRTKQRTPNRESVTPRSKKSIRKSTFHSTHPTTIFHLKITNSSLESQKTLPTQKQFPVKQRNVRAGSEIGFRGFRWNNDSSAEICRQIVPAIHNTSPRIKVTSHDTTTERTHVVSPLASPIDSAPLTPSLPLWKNIVLFLKKTFLPTSVDPLAKLYSGESQVDAPELLYLLELKQNKLKFVKPSLRRSISDASPKQLIKFGSTSLNSSAPMKSRVKKSSYDERNFLYQSSAPPDTGLLKQDFPVIKQSVKICRSKSTISSNSERFQTSLNTHHKPKFRKSIADNDCFSTHEMLSGIHNIKLINRSFPRSQNLRRDAFVVPMNRSVGEKHDCACSKEAEVRLSPRSLSPAPRSHSAIMTAGVSQGVSSILPERISLRDLQSNPRHKTYDFSL